MYFVRVYLNQPVISSIIMFLGWIFIFPVPLTILLLRNKDMKPAVKYGIIAAAWIVYLLIGFSGRNRNKNQNSQQNTQVSTEVDTAENNTNTETEETAGTNSENNVSHLYDSAEVRDLMNGSGTEKVGEYAVIKASSSDCTEENLADVYFNYFKANDFNYLVIIYSDKNDNSGVYVNSGYIGVDTSFEEDDKGDYSVKSSENEMIYYPSDDGKTIEKSTSNDGGDYTFIIDPNEKGDYGFENTLNKGTDSEETQIVYHIPAGTYKVKNLGEYQGQIEACSDNTHVTDEGWEEPEDVKGAVSLEPDEEVEFSIEDGYYLEVHLNGTLGFTEVK